MVSADNRFGVEIRCRVRVSARLVCRQESFLTAEGARVEDLTTNSAGDSFLLLVASEGQKVRRKIRSTRRVLSALLKKRREGSGLSVEEIAGLDAQIASHQEVLRQHLDDLTYIVVSAR